MAVSCPSCGAALPVGARFCMTCGGQLAGQQPPAPPPGWGPPPPAFPPATATAPATAQPQPQPQPPTVTAPAYAYPPAPAPAPALPAPPLPGPPPRAFGDTFLGRTLTGDWARSLLAAVLAPVFLLVSAALLTIPIDKALSSEDGGDSGVGWGERFQVALAILLRGVGGQLELKSRRDGDGGYGDTGAVSTLSYEIVPLTVTVLFVAALWAGARLIRSAPSSGTAAAEATVRVAVLTGALTLLLALFSQPEMGDVELATTPVLGALGAAALSLLVTGGVLARPWLTPWLTARAASGWLTVLRAARAAGWALAAVLALATVTVWTVLAFTEDWSDVGAEGYTLIGLLLLNAGVAALGFSWGAPLEAEGSSSAAGIGGWENESLGLSELGDEFGGLAVFGTVAGGLVAALLIGWLAGRLVRGSVPGQLLTGVLFVSGFLLAAWAGSFRMVAWTSGGTDAEGERGIGAGPSGAGSETSMGPGAELVAVALLWVGVAVLLVPYLVRLTGRRPPPAGYPGYGGYPGVPGQPVYPGQPYPPARLPPQAYPQTHPHPRPPYATPPPPAPPGDPQAGPGGRAS